MFYTPQLQKDSQLKKFMLRKLSLCSNATIFWVNSAQWASHTQREAGSAISELISFVGVMQIRLTRETRGGASFSNPKGKGVRAECLKDKMDGE